jgi:uncharacterized protein (DUF427 family)
MVALSMSEASRPRLTPGPDHPITITASDVPVTATLDGVVVATSTHALVLAEASYPPVYYFPREDVVAGAFTPTDHETYCPYKGECSYFTVAAGSRTETNAAWSYERPYDAVAEIAGHVAFYPDRVEVQPA